ncbi:hypothetical protein [Luteimonas suaedae]|uniref:hypothetical protein n=1 Tax=Luteimonas suaedae TaxID=2605430 RepID=UPI0011F062CE|nr:hypothetical protein [Luteimonas suaedae]
MGAMPRVPTRSDGRRDPGPAGASVTGMRGRRLARGIAGVARSYEGTTGAAGDALESRRLYD